MRPSWEGPIVHIGGTSIVINPGTGPVEDATLENAEASIAAFVQDLGIDVVWIARRPQQDKNGRYGFILRRNDCECIIEMPGLPVEQVRYIKAPGQKIYDFPRLYVDGSSWVWRFALSDAKRALMGTPDDGEEAEVG